jgi:glycosyltransferase involved in cell wall biosynthesis
MGWQAVLFFCGVPAESAGATPHAGATSENYLSTNRAWLMTHPTTPEISFVVIGYNEGIHLRAALRSVQQCALHEERYELIYVDGGSTDGSMQTAREMGVDQVLGGDRRRRAAENRNLGLAAARGEFVQFLDGDMELHPAWPETALSLLQEKPEEKRNNVFYDALQLDWDMPEGPALFCGGAAMWRREVLQKLGGFPEDVSYGEEPYVCWRCRRELKQQVWHMHRRMALHDLAYTGFLDYWRRNEHVGVAYAEIAARCAGGSDKFWSAEVKQNLRWGLALSLMLLAFVFGGGLIKGVALLALLIIIGRKTHQTLQREVEFEVALIYAVHTYLCKLGIAWGIVKQHWKARKPAAG